MYSAAVCAKWKCEAEEIKSVARYGIVIPLPSDFAKGGDREEIVEVS